MIKSVKSEKPMMRQLLSRLHIISYHRYWYCCSLLIGLKVRKVLMKGPLEITGGLVYSSSAKRNRYEYGIGTR